jgi:hypothetical protein
MRWVINANLYVVMTGVQLRQLRLLPREYPR